MLEKLPLTTLILTSVALALGSEMALGHPELLSGMVGVWLGLVGLPVGLCLGAGLKRSPKGSAETRSRALLVALPVALGAWALLGCVIQAQGLLDMMAVAPIALVIAAVAIAVPPGGAAPAAGLAVLAALVSLKGAPSHLLGLSQVPAVLHIGLGLLVGALAGMPLSRLRASSPRARHITLGAALLASAALSMGLDLATLWVALGMGTVLGTRSSARRRLVWHLEGLGPALFIVPTVFCALLWPPMTMRALLLGIGFAAVVWACGRLVEHLTGPATQAPNHVGLAVAAAMLGQSMTVWRRPSLGAEIVHSITKGEHPTETAPTLVTDVHSALFVGALMLAAFASRSVAYPRADVLNPRSLVNPRAGTETRPYDHHRT